MPQQCSSSCEPSHRARHRSCRRSSKRSWERIFRRASAQAYKKLICFHPHCGLTDIYRAWVIPCGFPVSVLRRTGMNPVIRHMSKSWAVASLLPGSWLDGREAAPRCHLPGAGSQHVGRAREMSNTRSAFCVLSPWGSGYQMGWEFGCIFPSLGWSSKCLEFLLKNCRKVEAAGSSPPEHQLLPGGGKKNAW